MLQCIKDHPAESLALGLGVLNLLGKLAGEVQNPAAKRILGFLSALGPDVVDAIKALSAPKEKL